MKEITKIISDIYLLGIFIRTYVENDRLSFTYGSLWLLRLWSGNHKPSHGICVKKFFGDIFSELEPYVNTNVLIRLLGRNKEEAGKRYL